MAAATAKKSRVQKELDKIKSTILRWTGMSELEYGTQLFEEGIEFLEHMEGKHQTEDFKALQSNRSYWTWWQSQRLHREQLFVDTILYNNTHLTKSAMLGVYQRWHRLPNLVDTPIEASYYRLLYAIEKNK